MKAGERKTCRRRFAASTWKVAVGGRGARRRPLSLAVAWPAPRRSLLQRRFLWTGLERLVQGRSRVQMLLRGEPEASVVLEVLLQPAAGICNSACSVRWTTPCGRGEPRRHAPGPLSRQWISTSRASASWCGRGLIRIRPVPSRRPVPSKPMAGSVLRSSVSRIFNRSEHALAGMRSGRHGRGVPPICPGCFPGLPGSTERKAGTRHHPANVPMCQCANVV